MFAGGAISWSSKLQKTVALSTTESEYRAGGHACQEVLWLRGLTDELKLSYLNAEPLTLFIDNEGAKALTKNPEYHSRTKHIELKYYFVQELVEAGVVDFQSCGTDDMVADICTKPLARAKHSFFCKEIGLSWPSQENSL
jgi:hypothetical protein